jgi:hypothetical protein
VLHPIVHNQPQAKKNLSCFLFLHLLFTRGAGRGLRPLLPVSPVTLVLGGTAALSLFLYSRAPTCWFSHTSLPRGINYYEKLQNWPRNGVKRSSSNLLRMIKFTELISSCYLLVLNLTSLLALCGTCWFILPLKTYPSSQH